MTAILNPVPSWSDMLSQHREITIRMVDYLEVPAMIDRETNTVWIRESYDAVGVDELVSAGLAALKPKRPELTALSGGGTDNTRPVRPALRLVRDHG